MSAHNALQENHEADKLIADPGDGGTIFVDRLPAVCAISSSGNGSESRTLGEPLQAGDTIVVCMDKYDGDISIAFPEDINDGGDDVVVFGDPGQWAKFMALPVGGSLHWRLIASDGVNVTN